MSRRTVFSAVAAAALAASAATAMPTASASPATPPSTHAVRACADPVARGDAACFAEVLADATGKIITSADPLDAAFTPKDVQAAYNLTGLKSGGRTVAIIDAYGYPTLEADLKVFRSTYGLPPCTTSNGCLKILDQHGGQDYPVANPGWDLEQALDVDAVSAACPDCKIIVVQARNSTLKNLARSVETAAAQKGVVAISNSYGGGEKTSRKQYDQPGIAVTVSTGDSGWTAHRPAYPASDPNVVAVGGTSVRRTADDAGRAFTETAWAGAGSGCSRHSAKPAWQKPVGTTCTTRAYADVSAAADPGFGGLSVYYNGSFIQVGGTSESSPIIAAVFALSGHTEGYPAKIVYDNPDKLFDITTGTNGTCGVPICGARKGWDGPTGLGTPNGVKGF